MVTELQFVAVAAFLIWGLVASLCGVLTAAPDALHLIKHDRGPANDSADSSAGDGVSGMKPHNRAAEN
jgi:hypothetical protein